jgi:hypothetical protein
MTVTISISQRKAISGGAMPRGRGKAMARRRVVELQKYTKSLVSGLVELSEDA